jgi:putative inorganic carbon (hco3(-)) transporter
MIALVRGVKFLSDNQLWWSLALAPILLLPGRFPYSLCLAAVALMALPWACRIFVPVPLAGDPIASSSWPRFEVLVLIYLLWHLPGFYATADSTISLEKFSQQLVGIGIACGLLAKQRSGPELKRLLFLAVLGAAALGLIGPLITQWQWPSKLLPALPAFVTSPSGWKLNEQLNPNILGGLMVLMLPLAIALAATNCNDYSNRPRLTRVVQFAMIGIIGAVLVISQARGGYIGAAVSLLLMAGLAGGRWRWVTAASLWAAFAGALWFGTDRLKDLLGGVGLVNSWDVRSELWSRASYMIQDFAFTGVGPGMYGKVADVLYPFFLISPDSEISHAHNLMLQVGVDLGIPGLVIYCAMIAFCLRAGFSSGGLDSTEKAIRIGLVAGVAGMLIHGLMDCATWSNKLAPAPWFLLGMLAAAGAGRRSILKRWEVLVWWLLVSLLSISFAGDHFGWALALAIGGGVLIGLLA